MNSLENLTRMQTQLEQASVTALYYYPIKSCGERAVPQAELTPTGFRHDRELMLVEAATGMFLTQREFPRMALIRPRLDDATLGLEAPGMSDLEIGLTKSGPTGPVTIWHDRCEAVDQGDEVAGWFGEFLKTDCRLVRMAPNFARRLSPDYALQPTDQVSFADAYPYLIISEESLADLNQRLPEPLPMNRFRPNIVVAGSGLAFGEDRLGRFTLGPVTFSNVKPCARCQITTTDQAIAAVGKEPLRTLATFRRTSQGKVTFGMNLIPENLDTLCLGDRLKVLSLK